MAGAAPSREDLDPGSAGAPWVQNFADLPTARHVFRLSSRRRQSSGHLRPLPPNNQPPPPIGGFRFGVRDLFLSTTLLSRPPKRFWWRRLTTGFGIFTLEFGI